MRVLALVLFVCSAGVFFVEPALGRRKKRGATASPAATSSSDALPPGIGEVAMERLKSMDPAEFKSICEAAGFTEEQTKALVNEMLVDQESLGQRLQNAAAGEGHPPRRAAAASAAGEHAAVHRPMLLHQSPVPLAPSLPRISVHELETAPGAEPYRNRSLPFILSGAMDNWLAPQRWGDPAYLPSLLGDEAVAEFYPYNMLAKNQAPALLRLAKAAQQLTSKSGDPDDAFPPPPRELQRMEGRYMHVQLTPLQLRALEAAGDISGERNQVLQVEEWKRCMPSEVLQTEYNLKTHWQLLLIGSRGAGMFNHSDALQSASWHAHVTGRKWWYVCKHGACYESVLEPGEVLYYSAGWSHHTQNLETPTIAATGTTVHRWNHQLVAQRLRGECVAEGLGLHFSAALCDALDHCYELWREEYGPADGHDTPWGKWREAADPAVVSRKMLIDPANTPYVAAADTVIG
jgi:hypothetical protein